MSETAVAKPSKEATLKDIVSGDKFKLQLATILPKHITNDRFVRVVLTAMMKTPRLMECDQTSFFLQLLKLAEMGLEPDGRRAHLIPFRNNKKNITECQSIPDYKGLAELVMRSGLVSKIHGDVVCENDEFEYNLGEILKHKIDFKKPRGKVYAVYSLVAFKDGGVPKCDVMAVEEVEAIRKRSKSPNDGPWVTDWNEMAKKTVFKRNSKWLPLTPELKTAIEIDDELSGFDAAIPIESTVETGKTKPTFKPVTRPKALSTPEPESTPSTDSEQVPDSSGLSPQPVPENPTEAEVFPNLARNESTDIAGKPDPATTAPRTVQQDLAEAVYNVPGCTIETFRAVCVALGWINPEKKLDSVNDLSDSTARKLYGARITLSAKLAEAVAKGIV